MIEFAELLVDTVACADWAFFAKNGNDVTTLAVMAARAHTHRKKIVFFRGYYHGVAPWTQKIDYPGVIEEDVMHNIYVPWNDIEALKQVFHENRGQIAAVIGQPYMHGNFMDNELPAKGFWQAVRKMCTDNGTVLIVDDVRAGFRLDMAGSDHYFGFEADLICFCKALANGYNVSALCGKEFDMDCEFYRDNIRPAEYSTVLHIAHSAIRFNDTVILNAPFGKEVRNAKFMRSLREKTNATGAELWLIWVHTPTELCKARMAERGAERDILKLENWEAYVKKVNYSVPYELDGADALDRFIVFDNENDETFSKSLDKVLGEIKGE
jgi:hypothetical protein